MRKRLGRQTVSIALGIERSTDPGRDGNFKDAASAAQDK
jgi:hypothetical protein